MYVDVQKMYDEMVRDPSTAKYQLGECNVVKRFDPLEDWRIYRGTIDEIFDSKTSTKPGATLLSGDRYLALVGAEDGSYVELKVQVPIEIATLAKGCPFLLYTHNKHIPGEGARFPGDAETYQVLEQILEIPAIGQRLEYTRP